eukprot:396593-Pyramimonas_sp.AAC.2
MKDVFTFYRGINWKLLRARSDRPSKEALFVIVNGWIVLGVSHRSQPCRESSELGVPWKRPAGMRSGGILETRSSLSRCANTARASHPRDLL